MAVIDVLKYADNDVTFPRSRRRDKQYDYHQISNAYATLQSRSTMSEAVLNIFPPGAQIE